MPYSAAECHRPWTILWSLYAICSPVTGTNAFPLQALQLIILWCVYVCNIIASKGKMKSVTCTCVSHSTQWGYCILECISLMSECYYVHYQQCCAFLECSTVIAYEIKFAHQSEVLTITGYSHSPCLNRTAAQIHTVHTVGAQYVGLTVSCQLKCTHRM